MKSISLVQANYDTGFRTTNGELTSSYYLPYSLGVLWSYVSSFQHIRENYRLDHVIWRRDPVDQVAERLRDQDIIGISMYAWNRNYSLQLAKKIHQLNPDVKIFLGGPEPAHTDPDFFRDHPYVTAVVINEGEVTFRRILENLDTLIKVPGLQLNLNLESINTGVAERINDVDIIPSPYLTGFFDPIINAPENQGIHWTATIETNRGCPYQCTFCDWGSLTYSKVKKFALERVFAELEWFGQNRIMYLSFADANFGVFVERDNMIVEYYIEVQKRYQYPKTFVASYAKNQRKEVLDIVEKLVKLSPYPNPGLHVSLQTLNDQTLDIIKRKNLKINDCESLFRMAESRGVPLGTEMIAGLPGETLESWKNNYCRLFEMNLHSGIDTFICQLLENAELNTVQREIYDIKTRTIYDYFSNTSEDDIAESLEVVHSTADMNEQDMIAALTWVWFLGMSHIGGFTNYISRFLVAQGLVTYRQFYDDFFDFLCQQTWFQDCLNKYTQNINHWYDHGRSQCDVHGLHIEGWRLQYLALMQIHADSTLFDSYICNIKRFLERFDIDNIAREDLYTLQFQTIITHWRIHEYPKTIDLQSNIYSYIVSGESYQAKKESLVLEYTDQKDLGLIDFLQKLHFRRRRNFGKAWITKK